MRWIDALVQAAHERLGERELEALWCRGVTDEQIAKFQVGHLVGLVRGITYPKEFVTWTFSGKKLQDVFVFPLTNALGQVKGLQFRHVERDAKGYTDYFLAKDEPVFFGLHQAMPAVWSTKTICLVEGAFDLFPVQRVFPQTVATLTASVSQAFIPFLRRNVSEVWFGYDMDSTGRRGAFDFLKEYRSDFTRILIPQFPQVRFADGKRAKDPSDAWEVMGDERFGTYLKAAFGQK